MPDYVTDVPSFRVMQDPDEVGNYKRWDDTLQEPYDVKYNIINSGHAAETKPFRIDAIADRVTEEEGNQATPNLNQTIAKNQKPLEPEEESSPAPIMNIETKLDKKPTEPRPEKKSKSWNDIKEHEDENKVSSHGKSWNDISASTSIIESSTKDKGNPIDIQEVESMRTIQEPNLEGFRVMDEDRMDDMETSASEIEETVVPNTGSDWVLSQFDWDGNGTPKPSSSENLPGKKVSEQNEAIISESNSTDKLSVEPVQHRSPQIINNKRDELPDDKVTNFIPFHPDEEKETDLLTQFIQKGKGGEDERRINKVLSGTVEQLKIKGINIASSQESCGKNEVYLLDKEKMVLISSGNIAHELSGLSKFEDNLLSQIKNQEEIINTLKSRLNSHESQTSSSRMKHFANTFKATEESHKMELGMSKKLLKFSQEKTMELDHKNQEQEKLIADMVHEIENLKIFLKIKDKKINALTHELEHGKAMTEVENLRDELLESKRETEMQKDARLKLEENFSKIIQANYEEERTEKMIEKSDSKKVGLLMEQIKEQDTRLKLLLEQITEQKRTVEFLSGIILQKDDMVLKLQGQVHGFLNHDSFTIKGCMEKEILIKAQNGAMSNLKSLSFCQDKYSQARDTALKILQHTVYEMVEKIPSCREKAVEGLKGELSALAKAQKPLQEMVEKLQTTVQASMHITQGNNDTEVLTKANEVIKNQQSALDLCQIEMNSQRLTQQMLTDIQSQRLEGLVKMQ